MSNEMIVNAVRKLKGVWPQQDFVVNGYFAESDQLYKLAVKGLQTGRICSKGQFQANLENLQNKPKFEDHPDAKCFVQDHLGQWFKNTLTADVWAVKDFESWVTYKLPSWVSVGKGEVIGEWRDTLTLPTSTDVVFEADRFVIENKVTGEVFGFSNSSAHVQLQQALSKGKLTAEDFKPPMFEVFGSSKLPENLTSAQNRTGKGLHSECTVTNEADLWYINKELPPEGSVVEYDDCGTWRKVRIICRHPVQDCVWHEPVEGTFSCGTSFSTDGPNSFRPIQTNREKFGEQILRVCPDISHHHVTQLFDSGEFFYKPNDVNNET